MELGNFSEFGLRRRLSAKAQEIAIEKLADLSGKMHGTTKFIGTSNVYLAKKYNLEIVALGHAGDGNLHPAILTDITDVNHYQKATEAMDEIFQAAVEFGGVISGEHGIGLEKQKFLMMKGVEKVITLKL